MNLSPTFSERYMPRRRGRFGNGARGGIGRRSVEAARGAFRASGVCAILCCLVVTAACGQAPPREATATAEPQMGFVASSRGEVFYSTRCDDWRSLAPANLRWFATAAEAEAAGFRASSVRACQDPDAAGRPTPIDANRCTIRRVVDGDTVECEEAGERIRLILIDAPETSQGGAAVEAREALESLLPPESTALVELDVQERDRYGRILAYLYTTEGELVNELLARQGYVVTLVVPPNVRHAERIRRAVEDARAARRGLWSTSAFECAPADYRAGRCP